MQTRIVKCSSRETVKEIIKFNNSQNPLMSPDFRSNDNVQRRLKAEMAAFPGAEYTGGRRGLAGGGKSTNTLPSDTVAQALAAVHGSPHVAYHEKGKIWLNDSLYIQFFNDATNAEHIVWCYSLLKAVESKKSDLIHRENTSNDLPSDDKELLEMLRKRGSTILLTAAIASCTETILDRSILNMFLVSFGRTVSPANAQEFWKPVVDATVPFAAENLTPALTRGVDSGDQTRGCIRRMKSAVKSTHRTNRAIYEVFSSRIVFK